MAIYFFDKNQTLIKIVPESATFEAIQTQELDDDSLLKDTLSVTIKGDEKLLNAEYMAVKSYTGNAQTFDMYRIVTDTTPDKSMSFTGMGLAPYELNGHIIQDLRPANHSLSYTLNRVLDGTDWQLGYIEDGLSNVTTTFYYVSAKEALKELQSLVGCEFVFKVEISGQKITDKWIEVYSEMGNRTKKRFNYGTNALTVVRETNKADIFTALIGRGKGEEVTSAEDNESGQAGYGRKITFEDIEWSTANGNPLNKPIGQYYLELPQATQAYGIKNIDGTMKARVGIVDFDDEEDKNRLINLTYQQLLVSSRPKVLFKTTVANVGATGIGDTVTIHRHDLNIHYQTRVRKIVRNKLNDNKTQIELGDAVVTASTKQTKQNNATIKNLNNEIDKIKANVTTSQNSADGKNTIFYGSAEPERQRTGDTWYRPHPSIAGETQMLTWNGTAWELVIDTSDLTSVSRGVQDAISKAEEAKSLAVSEAESALAQAKADATAKANAVKEEVGNSVNTAIENAEDAKQTAIDNYNNAVAEAERLVGEQTTAFDTRFGDIENTVDTFNQSVADIDAKADEALEKAGANANLLTTHQNTIDTINTVTLPDITSSVGDALANAKSAMDEAKLADDKIADFVTTNGLVSGTTVDEKIDTATGAISKTITTVESKIPTEIGGRNYVLKSDTYYFTTNYKVAEYDLSKILKGTKIKISIWGGLDSGARTFGIYVNNASGLTSDNSQVIELTKLSGLYGQGRSTSLSKWTTEVTLNVDATKILVYGFDNNSTTPKRVEYIKIETGGLFTDWSQAPEDNYTQEEFKIFESTYNEDVKGITSSLTALENDKLDGSIYTTFYKNEYEKTAEGLKDSYEEIGKVIDENGNTTDTFAKAVYDKNATRRTEEFTEVTSGLVKENTYTAGINGLSGSISTISGQLDKLKASGGGRNYALKSNVYYYTTDYKVSEYDLAKMLKGTKIKISIWGALGTNARTFGVYINNGLGTPSQNSQIIELTKLDGVFGQGISTSLSKWTGEATLLVDATKILIFGLDNNSTSPKRIEYVKVETGETYTDWTIAPEDMLGKEDFQVFKTTYEANDETIKARLLAVDSGKEGSIAYRLNETEKTASGNTTAISNIKTKPGEQITGYQTIKERSELYERVIGTDEAGIKSNMARMVMTDSLFKTEVIKNVPSAIGGRNYVRKSNDYYYTTNYKVAEYDLSVIPKGTKIKISLWGGLGTNARTFGVYVNNSSGVASGNSQIIELAKLDGVFGQGVSTSLSKWTTEATLNVDASKILIFGLDNNSTSPKRIEYVKIETGDYYTDWTAAPEDKASMSAITQLENSIDAKVSDEELLSRINVRAGGVLITSGTNKLNITPTTTYIQDATIKSAMIDTVNVKKLTGIAADFTSMVTGALTANTITATMINANDAMFTKLFATKLATDKLVAQGAWITDANIVSLDAGTIKSGTIDTGRLDAGAIVTAGLSANVIETTHIKAEAGLVGKLFSQTAYIEELTNKTVFTEKIQAINISADKITTGTLDASRASVVNLDANNITANKTSFIQSNWNDIESSIRIDGSGLLSTASDNSQVYLQNGIVGARNPDGATIGRIGYAYETSSPWYSMQVSNGSHFQIRMSRGDGELNKQAFYIISGGRESYLNTDDIYLNPVNWATVQGRFRTQGETRIDAQLFVAEQLNFSKYGGYIQSQSNSNMLINASNNLVVYAKGSNALEIDGTHAVFKRQISENSDMRLKTNIVDMPIDSLDAIRNLEIKKFDYLDGRLNQYGIIAQQAQNYLPELIDVDSEGYLMVNKSATTYINMHAIQQLDKKVDDKVEQLEAKIASLQDELATLKGD